MFFPVMGKAQDYQKVKKILDCVVKMGTPLKNFPDAQADSIEQLKTRQTLQVLGKKGNWLDVQSSQSRGWVSTFYVEVIGISKNQRPKVIKRPSSKIRKVRNQTSQAFFSDLRLVPYTSYALGGKNFYDQIRLGGYATYKLSEFFSLGLLTEAVLLRGTYFSFGTTAHRTIPTAYAWLNPALQASVLYYSFDHSGDSDAGFGLQWAIENDFPLIQKPKFAILPVVRTGFDMVLISVDQVRVPFFFSLAVSMQF